MKKLLLYSSFFLLTVCCAQNRSNEGIALSKDNTISVTDLIDSIQIVQLEANDKCLIHTISKVLFYKGRYFIFDRKQQAVLCFNQDGKFIRKISDRGRGPQEYEYLGDIAIDPYHDQLLLVVPYGTVLAFDLNGNFVFKVNIPDAGAINELHILDTDRWLIVSLGDFQIQYLSLIENRIVERLYGEGVLVYPIFPLNRSYAYNDSIYFAPMFSNETLNMKDQSRRVAYSWDFGSLNNRPERIKSLIPKLQILRSQPSPPGGSKYDECMALCHHYLNYFIRYTRESSRYRIAVLDYKNDLMHIIYDKQARKSVVFRETKEGIRWINPSFMYNQDMVIAYDVEDTPYTSYANEILSVEQRQIIENNTVETDNPLLVIYYLKK